MMRFSSFHPFPQLLHIALTCFVAISCVRASWLSPLQIHRPNLLQTRQDPSLEDCPPPPAPLYQYPPRTCIRVQNTRDVAFHRRADWLTLDPALQQPLISAVQSGIIAVTEYYEKLVRPFKVDLTLVEFVADAKVGKTYKNGASCSIYIRWSRLPQKPLFVEFVTAHELYHCVQYLADPSRILTEAGSELWFIEGSANLFAYSFYQEQDLLEGTELEALSLRKYNPSVPLYKQSYTAALFFLYLNNKGWTREKIHKWVMGRRFSVDMLEEQLVLSRDVEISTAFNTFAVAFHDKEIRFRYPDGLELYIDNREDVAMTLKTVSVARVTETDKLALKVIPWTFVKYVVTVPAGQNIKITDDILRLPFKTTIRFRVKSASPAKWKEFPATGISTGCLGSAIEYEFLMVSTSAGDEITGEMTFLYKAECRASCDAGIPPALRARQIDTGNDTTTVDVPSTTPPLPTFTPPPFSPPTPDTPIPVTPEGTESHLDNIDANIDPSPLTPAEAEGPPAIACAPWSPSSSTSCLIGTWTLDTPRTSVSQRENVKSNGRSRIYQEEVHGSQTMVIGAAQQSSMYDVRIALEAFGITVAVEYIGTDVVSRTPSWSSGSANATLRRSGAVVDGVTGVESGTMVMRDAGVEGTTRWIKDDGMGTVVEESFGGLAVNGMVLGYNCSVGELVYRVKTDGMWFYSFFVREL